MAHDATVPGRQGARSYRMAPRAASGSAVRSQGFPRRAGAMLPRTLDQLILQVWLVRVYFSGIWLVGGRAVLGEIVEVGSWLIPSRATRARSTESKVPNPGAGVET